MAIPLRLLIVEDSEDDALLIARELRVGGYDVTYSRVDSPSSLNLACDCEDWNLIISDFSMPHFSGTDALRLVRSKNLDTPFIFVSGTMGEEIAVTAMRNGAQDYLMKDNLKRLLPAVRRELQEHAERRERRRLEKHVQQLQKFEAIGRLSGGIAHDFNNMIGAILGWAELGCEETDPATKSHTRFAKIREQSQRAAKLTSQLLAFGRKQMLQPRNVNLNILIQEEIGFLERVIEKNIEVRLFAAPDLHITRADPTQLQQVLMNLCLNARDAMPDGGQLTIQTANVEIDEAFRIAHLQAIPGSYVLLTIADTGIGMDPATVERVFEPFFTTKELGHGTGLGLATVYGIVKQHGGFIYVHSTLGKGASFQVYLPADMGTHDPVEFSAAEQPVKGSATILLAEDHDGLRDSLEESLQALGYHTLSSSDGIKAVDLFEQHADHIDLVLIDVVMPALSGSEAYLRMSAIRPGIPVIFTSGYAPKSESLLTLLENGALFLQKPYTLAKVSQAIREALASHRGNILPANR
jgi:two-component system, cell cycle sensor histidine kinase and response regulator CckA